MTLKTYAKKLEEKIKDLMHMRKMYEGDFQMQNEINYYLTKLYNMQYEVKVAQREM